MTDRHDELIADARELHGKARRWNDRWLLVGGGLALALGLVAILLGWYGAAQSTLDFEQTPYVISGGLLGVGLIVLGSFVYFSYWLTCLVRDNRESAKRTAAHQDRLEGLLSQLVADRSAQLVATEHGSVVHRLGCPATLGQSVHPATADDGELCDLCR
jgi:hypothetical protein